jgi:hypothetical protein
LHFGKKEITAGLLTQTAAVLAFQIDTEESLKRTQMARGVMQDKYWYE